MTQDRSTAAHDHSKLTRLPEEQEAALPAPPLTMPIERRPLANVLASRGCDRFDPDDSLVLQFLPSGLCVVTPLDRPMILGRRLGNDPLTILDLTALKAFQHGVSRQHCLLQRRGPSITVTDLGSTNNTYVNGERLSPYTEITLARGDELVLGTLHATIASSRAQP